MWIYQFFALVRLDSRGLNVVVEDIDFSVWGIVLRIVSIQTLLLLNGLLYIVSAGRHRASGSRQLVHVGNISFGLRNLLGLHRWLSRILPTFSKWWIYRFLKYLFTAQYLFQRSLRIHVWLNLFLLDNIGLINRSVINRIILLKLYSDINVVSLWMLLFLLLAILLNICRYLCLVCWGIYNGLHVYVLVSRRRIQIDIILLYLAGSERWWGSFNLVCWFQTLFFRINFVRLLKGPLRNIRFGRNQLFLYQRSVRRCHFNSRLILTDDLLPDIIVLTRLFFGDCIFSK